MKNPSIKLRIQIAVIVLILTILTVASIVLYLRIQKTFKIHTEKDLADIATLVAREIEVSDGVVVDDWYDDIQQDPISRKKDFIQSWGPDGKKTQRSPALGDINLPFFHGKLGEFVYRDVTLSYRDKKHQGRAIGLLVMPSFEGVEPQKARRLKKSLKPHILVVAIDTEDQKKFLEHLRWGIVFTILAVTVFSALIIHFILKSALLPIESLAIEIQEKNIHQLESGFIVHPQIPTELKDLVVQYNNLISRVEESRTREKNFSSYVAHELRTPLAGIATTLELALNRDREPSFYKKSISEALQITDSMQRLIERLKTLSLLQNKQTKVEHETINFYCFLKDLWRSYEKVSEKKSLQVIWQLAGSEVSVLTDQHLFYILISNLIENAVTYATPQSTILISTQIIDKLLLFSISNKTEELTSSDIRLIFDPFFRKDKARVMDGHHFGMGLSICQEISRELNANLKASINKKNEFTIECEFPLAS